MAPLAGRLGDLAERARLLEQVGGAGHDMEGVRDVQPPGRLLVEPQHLLVPAAHDQQHRGPDGFQGVARQVGPAAAGDDRRHSARPLGGGDQGRARAGAGAEQDDGQVAGAGRPGKPVDGGHQPATQQGDVEAEFGGDHVQPFLLLGEQVDQQGAESGGAQTGGDLAVAGTVPGAAAAVREQHDRPGAGRHDQITGEPGATGGQGDRLGVHRGASSPPVPVTCRLFRPPTHAAAGVPRPAWRDPTARRRPGMRAPGDHALELRGRPPGPAAT